MAAFVAGMAASTSSVGAAIFLTDWTSIAALPGTPDSYFNNTQSSTGTAIGTLTYPTGSSTLSYTGGIGVGGSGTITNISPGDGRFSTSTIFGAYTVGTSDVLVSNGFDPRTNAPGTNYYAKLHTINFSTPVTNPIMYIESLGSVLGSVTTTQTFTFSSPFTILATGSLGPGKPALTSVGNVLSGTESNGVIQFSGSISQIQWTPSTLEAGTSFQIGLSIVPEASSGLLAMLGSFAFLYRRRR